MGKAGGRPKGPEKKELTITLPLPIWDWLDGLLAERKIASKSFFIETLIRGAMEEERHREAKLAHASPQERRELLEMWERPKKG